MPELKGGIGKDGEIPRTQNKRLRQRPVSYVIRAMMRMIYRNGEGWAEDRIMQAIGGDPFPVWGEAFAWALVLETYRERVKLEEIEDESLEGIEPRHIATMLMAMRMQADLEAAAIEWDKRRARKVGL